MATSITTTSEFLNMSLSGDYILEADLDFGGAEIVGIGQTSGTFFTGHFDGNYHTISNYRINFSNVGTLFYGVGLNGIVERLTIDNGKPQTGYYAGMIAGWTEKNGIIRNCKVMNTEMYLSSIQYGGVFVGRTMDTSKVENCFAVNITTNESSLDGAVSNILDSSTTSDCFYVDNLDITDNGSGIPLTDSEAKTASTYIGTGLDSSEWTIVDGEYPVLGVQAQQESDGIHVPISIAINSQTVLERHSDGVEIDLGIDVNSQVILERHSNGIDVGLQIDINSQEVTESYSNGSNIDLNIEVSSQELETFSRGSSVDLVINIEGEGRQTLDLIQETILLADLERGITLKGDRNVNINLIGTKDSETILNAEF